jgi:uncharacterized membrane protein
MFTFLGLTFLNPVLLVGVLSAAIPLLLHLSRSRRTKKMRFSTTRFFTEQFLRSYRMSRLKELLLLACRMALCALLAMALAQPLLQTRADSFLGGHGAHSVVLVLDNSASMGYSEGGMTLLERARAAAREVLAGLKPGRDRASLVLVGRQASGPEVLFAEPTPDLGDVLQAVNSVQVAALGTDLRGAVMRAETLLAGHADAGKQVYLFSDLQDSGWELPDSKTQAAGSADVAFSFVQVKPRTVAHVGITALQYAAARPTVGVPFALRPQIVVQGEGVGACDVRLFVYGKDGKAEKVAERRLEKLPDGRWPAPRFHHTFTTGGWHAGYVEVDDEAFPLDNRRYFAFEVLDSIKVLAVNGAPSDVPRLDELFFLKTALTAAPEGRGPIQVDVVNAPDLASTDLASYPLVVLANVESLPAVAVQNLETFVDRGGSLLVFLGDKIHAAFYNQDLAGAARLHGGLLPGRILQLQAFPAAGAKTDEEMPFIAEVDYQHPALAAFQEPKFANLAGVTFKAFWQVEPGTSAVLMRTSTGAPLLVEKEFGKGRVVLFASTCDRDWTNFPVRPAYLPWTHRLVGYLAQQPLAGRTFHATGDRVALPVSAFEGLERVVVRKPDGISAAAVTADDPAHPLVFAETLLPGIYAIDPDRKDKAPLFAVNLEGYESDLTYLDDVLADRATAQAYPNRQAKIEAGLKELLPGRPLVRYVDDPAKVGEALRQGDGLALWDMGLWLVLLIALFEPWLANRISLRLYGRPREVAEGATRRSGLLPTVTGSTPPQEVGSP